MIKSVPVTNSRCVRSQEENSQGNLFRLGEPALRRRLLQRPKGGFFGTVLRHQFLKKRHGPPQRRLHPARANGVEADVIAAFQALFRHCFGEHADGGLARRIGAGTRRGLEAGADATLMMLPPEACFGAGRDGVFRAEEKPHRDSPPSRGASLPGACPPRVRRRRRRRSSPGCPTGCEQQKPVPGRPANPTRQSRPGERPTSPPSREMAAAVACAPSAAISAQTTLTSCRASTIAVVDQSQTLLRSPAPLCPPVGQENGGLP